MACDRPDAAPVEPALVMSRGPGYARLVLQVIASDLDGTLFGSDGKVAPFTASALREIDALGLTIVLATSRHQRNASFIRDRLGLRAHLITLNGARAHGPDGERIFAHDLEPAVARALLSPEMAGHNHLSAFCDAGWLVNRPYPELDAHFEGTGFASEVHDLTAHDGAGVPMVAYVGKEDDIARLETRILERFSGRVCPAFITSYCLQVTAAEASKGRALTEILRRLGVPPGAVVAFGDGDNDIDMLSVAGRRFVMDQSSSKLRAALPDAPSAGSNDEAGVARTLRRLLALPA